MGCKIKRKPFFCKKLWVMVFYHSKSNPNKKTHTYMRITEAGAGEETTGGKKGDTGK